MSDKLNRHEEDTIADTIERMLREIDEHPEYHEKYGNRDHALARVFEVAEAHGMVADAVQQIRIKLMREPSYHVKKAK